MNYETLDHHLLSTLLFYELATIYLSTILWEYWPPRIWLHGTAWYQESASSPGYWINWMRCKVTDNNLRSKYKSIPLHGIGLAASKSGRSLKNLKLIVTLCREHLAVSILNRNIQRHRVSVCHIYTWLLKRIKNTAVKQWYLNYKHTWLS